MGNRYNGEKRKYLNFSSTCTNVPIIKYDELLFNNKFIRNNSRLSEKLRLDILTRDGYRCYICGGEDSLEVHHIIPRKLGGKHIAENLVTLCVGCHRSVESGNVDMAVKKCVNRVYKNILKPC